MKTAYLGLGANIGDKLENLREAVRLIDGSDGCEVTAVSPVYVTRPVGYEHQPDFANAVAEVRTSLSPRELLELCNRVEEILGRRRTIRWGPRVIDVDIILYEGENVAEDGLMIPHPRMMERAFVLVPLADVAPDIGLPDGHTASEAAASIDREGIKITSERLWSR